GDFQFLKSGSDEPCIQPIESSQLGPCPGESAPAARFFLPVHRGDGPAVRPRMPAIRTGRAIDNIK
ncbi:hypothetical protein L557_2590, partial [Bordetella pertussis STO1-CNMC-0004]